MAKYDITFKCGHTETRQLFGPNKERQSKIQWLETCLCSECYKKQQLEKAKQYETENNLPELSGSEKQIKWAKSIRANELKYVEAKLKTGGYTTEEYNTYFRKVVNEYFNQFTEAKWWIDKRDDDLFYECIKDENVKKAVKHYDDLMIKELEQ